MSNRQPGKLILIIGLLAICVGAWFLVASVWMLEARIKTTAKVVSVKVLDSGSGSDRTRSYQPTVRYKVSDGRTVVSQCPYGSSMFDFEKGASVEILYDPNKPADFRFNSFIELWMMPLIALLIGGFALWMGWPRKNKDGQST